MNMGKNSPLTPGGREMMVRYVVDIVEKSSSWRAFGWGRASGRLGTFGWRPWVGGARLRSDSAWERIRRSTGEAPEVLSGRRKQKLIFRAVWTTQSQTRQTKDSLEVRVKACAQRGGRGEGDETARFHDRTASRRFRSNHEKMRSTTRWRGKTTSDRLTISVRIPGTAVSGSFTDRALQPLSATTSCSHPSSATLHLFALVWRSGVECPARMTVQPLAHCGCLGRLPWAAALGGATPDRVDGLSGGRLRFYEESGPSSVVPVQARSRPASKISSERNGD